MAADTERKTCTAGWRCLNHEPTLREMLLPGPGAPVSVGSHPEVADVYGIPEDAYEETAATYDDLTGAVASCLTGVLSGMLEARGVVSGDGRITADATGETEWRDRVLRVKGIRVRYTIQADGSASDVIARIHEQHVGRCSMAQSPAGAIEVTTSYELT
jgi:uncharacterized OsmC-like protein